MIKNKISFLILTAAFIFSFSTVKAQGYNDGGYYPPSQQPQTLQGRVSYVPAGTPVSARLQNALSSEFSRVGETFTATLSSSIYAGSQIVAAPGSTVQGQVVSVTPAGRGGRPGAISLRLTSIITPEGRRYPLSASVDNANFQLKAGGGTASHLVKTTAVGAGAGALSGLIGGAIAGGKKGKATAIGTGIGGGVGLLGGAIKKGKEFVIPSGTIVPFRLDTAMQVNAAAAAPQAAPSGFQQAPGNFQDPGYQYR